MFKKILTNKTDTQTEKKEKEKLKSTQKNIRITRWRHKMKNNLVHKNNNNKKIQQHFYSFIYTYPVI